MFPIRRLLLAACLSSAAVCVPAQSATAQSGLPACPPPASNEYLLLVRGETEAERAEIADILPIESAGLICQYTDEVLVRAGGFTSLETANAWASFAASQSACSQQWRHCGEWQCVSGLSTESFGVWVCGAGGIWHSP